MVFLTLKVNLALNEMKTFGRGGEGGQFVFGFPKKEEEKKKKNRNRSDTYQRELQHTHSTCSNSRCILLIVVHLDIAAWGKSRSTYQAGRQRRVWQDEKGNTSSKMSCRLPEQLDAHYGSGKYSWLPIESL